MACATLLLLLVVAATLLAAVSAHSEQFHRFPMSKLPPVERQLVRGQSEPYLQNVQMLLGDGTLAEAYWNANGTEVSFQGIMGVVGEEHPCDLIYSMRSDGTGVQLQSPVAGHDTCSIFSHDGTHLYFSSTMDMHGNWCPATPDMASGYLWPIYAGMNVYSKHLSSGKLTRLTHHKGYNAETTMSPDGSQMIFTSDRDGDLELYIANVSDPTFPRRVTYSPGYDGGAWFSNRGDKLCWRAMRPLGEALTDYLELLELGLVAPIGMQLYVSNADGTGAFQVAPNGLNGTSFAPFFLPDDSGLIFSSNMADPDGGEFQLYIINLDGSGLQQITYEGTFNAFPMFSPDGKTLIWASNRDTSSYTDIDIYVAQWDPNGVDRTATIVD